MEQSQTVTGTNQRWASGIRRLMLGWLTAAALEYLLLPVQAQWLGNLEGLAQMSLIRLIAVTCGVFCVLSLIGKNHDSARAERWGIFAMGALLVVSAVRRSYTAPFWWGCLLLMGIVTVYAFFGWNAAPEPASVPGTRSWGWMWGTGAAAAAALIFLSVWTVSRVYTLSTPTYDMGLFSQMFHHMKESGRPMTTLERDGLLSHFAVHVSPIYYLMLPLYALIPSPVTLQVLQAAVLVSSVIPLWKLGQRHGMAGWQRFALCVVLLAYPALAGGVSYDLHENCFLTPLLLWLFYAVDVGHIPGIALAGGLTLLVKEDAAVYVAVIALWMILRGLLREPKDRRMLVTGLTMLGVSLIWFFLVTGYLAGMGDGVMTYRYDNFIYDGSSSLVTVVLAVLKNPMKLLYECVDAEKLRYIGLTMVPLLGLPLMTRRFERYVLLIPYILVNLMSDYSYQHDVFFQYNFGSGAFLLYLTVVNLQDIPKPSLRTAAIGLVAAVSLGCFAEEILPKAVEYPQRLARFSGYYSKIRSALDQIPEGAPTSATTFYTTMLSRRDVLYDVKYSSTEHILQTDYVAMDPRYPDTYDKYATAGGNDGFQRFVELLEQQGYERWLAPDDSLVIYRRMIDE